MYQQFSIICENVDLFIKCSLDVCNYTLPYDSLQGSSCSKRTSEWKNQKDFHKNGGESKEDESGGVLAKGEWDFITNECRV